MTTKGVSYFRAELVAMRDAEGSVREILDNRMAFNSLSVVERQGLVKILAKFASHCDNLEAIVERNRHADDPPPE